jgi:hypothetical protein
MPHRYRQTRNSTKDFPLAENILACYAYCVKARRNPGFGYRKSPGGTGASPLVFNLLILQENRPDDTEDGGAPPSFSTPYRSFRRRTEAHDAAPYLPTAYRS